MAVHSEGAGSMYMNASPERVPFLPMQRRHGGLPLVFARNGSTAMVKKAGPRLCELAPMARGGHVAGICDLRPAFFTDPVQWLTRGLSNKKVCYVRPKVSAKSRGQ